MKKGVIFLILLLFFLLFPSCQKSSLKSLFLSGEYEAVYQTATESLKTKMSEESLYFKAASLYKLGRYDEASQISELYLKLFSTSKVHRASILRIILFTGDSLSALSAGRQLYEGNNLNKDDSVQFYKVLNQNGLYKESKEYIASISDTLSVRERCFTVVNGRAPSLDIISSLEELYLNEGCSDAFINGMRAAFSIFAERGVADYIIPLLNKTYNGNAQYSLDIGDFYFNIGQIDSAIYYWNIAKDSFPEAVATRMNVINRNY